MIDSLDIKGDATRVHTPHPLKTDGIRAVIQEGVAGDLEVVEEELQVVR